MIYGKMVGELVVITTLEDGGKEITETAPPSTIPDNYRLEYHWEDQGAQIMQVWTLAPVGGNGTRCDAHAGKDPGSGFD